MSDPSGEEILEMLNNIFTTCDVDGTGVVDINTLVNFLTQQDPAWHKDQTLEEEFCKVLDADEQTQSISKDHFISSLLSHIKLKNHLEEDNNHDEMSTQEVAGSRQSTDDTQDPEMVLVSIGNNNINNTEVQFVADGQTLSSEDVADEVSVLDCESPPVNKQLVRSLQEEINALQRKTEFLESANNSLICQILSLEESITKNEKESAADLKKLLASHHLLEMQKHKQEEVEERLCLFVDDNKSVTIQLSQSERENSKLKEFIAQMEKQIELISSEKLFQDTKLKDIKEKYNTLNDLFTKSQVELESLKMKDKTGEESIEQLVDQNTNLKLQLESSDYLVQDLKSQLAATFKELSNLQNEKIKARLHNPNLSENQSSDNTMIFFDENFSLDNTIPFEQSILAELQEKRTCTCDCMRDLTFTTSSPVSSEKFHLLKSDVSVSTDEKTVTHQATMTTPQGVKPIPSAKNCRDVGVNCSIKVSSFL
uniref:EF-hand domain-containing protein n=1 Tax=Graphocephala atropunctata TaxID=36148 RepID=A0A1B6LFT7_9HEMI